MGAGRARRKGGWTEWKFLIWECLWGNDVNILPLIENSKTLAGRKKLKIAQTGEISNSRGSSRDFQSRHLGSRDNKTQ